MCLNVRWLFTTMAYNVPQLTTEPFLEYSTFKALLLAGVMFRFFSIQYFLESTVVVQLVNNTATRWVARDLYDSYARVRSVHIL